MCRTRYCGTADAGFVCSADACRGENVKRKEAARLAKAEAVKAAKEARQELAKVAAQSARAATHAAIAGGGLGRGARAKAPPRPFY